MLALENCWDDMTRTFFARNQVLALSMANYTTSTSQKTEFWVDGRTPGSSVSTLFQLGLGFFPASSFQLIGSEISFFYFLIPPPGSITNEPMEKPALTHQVIPHPALNPSTSNSSSSPSAYDLYGPKPKSVLNNPTLDAISVRKGWSNVSLFLPYICLCFEPEGYGLPPMNPILCDDVDTRFLLEASGNYYLYNHVSDTLYQINCPTELSSIVPALGDWKGIKITEMEHIVSQLEPMRLPALFGQGHCFIDRNYPNA